MLSRVCTLLWLLLLTATPVSHAGIAEHQVRFRSWGSAEGLSHPTTRAIIEDAHGFLWFGTQDGLNRFDGHEFLVLGRNALGDAHVTALARDGGQGLWIGTLQGSLLHFDLVSHAVQRHELDGGEITALFVDGDTLWVAGAAAGPQRLQVRDGSAPSSDPALSTLRGVTAIRKLADGALLFCGRGGLQHWQPGAEPRDWPLSAQTRVGDCRALALTDAGDVLVGSNHGVLQIGPDGRLRHHFDRTNGGLPGEDVRALALLGADELWVGLIDGLALVNLADASVRHWTHEAGNPASLSGNRVATLYVDSRGLLWIGTWAAGLSLHDPATRVLSVIRERPGEVGGLPASAVRAISGDADGSLWLGLSEGGGLVRATPSGQVLQTYGADLTAPDALPSALIRCVLRRTDGSLWVGMNGGGLARQGADGRFQRFGNLPGGDGSLPSRIVTTLHEARDGTLWIGTEDAGLWRQCRGCDGFARVDTHGAKPDLPRVEARVMDIAEDARGRLWVGYFGEGIHLLDRDGQLLRHFGAMPGRADSLPGGVIAHIVPAADGSIWVASWGAGLTRLRESASGSWTAQAFGQESGLRSDTLAAVLIDERGQLWISHGRGIDRFDPASGRAFALDLSDGIDRAGYYPASAWREADGTLNFGGWSGWMRFHPRAIGERRQPLTPRLTRFAIANRSILPAARDPNSPLKQDIGHVAALELPYAARMFSIEFSALDYASPGATRYRFRLEGLDADWIEASAAQRIATYANPPPGHYRLAIDAATALGEFTPGVRLPVVLQPPWWDSPLARAVYGLIATALVATFWRARQLRQAAKRAALEDIKRSREQLATALWGSRDELWDLDAAAGKIEWQNPFDYLEPELHRYHSNYADFLAHIHPDDARVLQHAWREHMEGRSAHLECAYRVRNRHSGEWLWLLSRGQAVKRDGNGHALRVVGTNTNITPLKEVEARLREINETLEERVAERTRDLSAANERLNTLLAELRQAQESLIQQEKMASLGGMVAGVAHELNTPLGIALTASSTVSERLVELSRKLDENRITRTDLNTFRATLAEAMELIMSSLQRANKLISSFKQVAVDQASEQRRDFQLGQFLQDLRAALHPQCRKKGCVLEVECADVVLLESYPGALFQILTNLIGNALIHAFPDGGGQIRVEGRAIGDEAEIRCHDNGVGMTPEIAAKVFEPFFTTRRGVGGSGLGLHISYNLATQILGGSLTLRTAPGGGAEFTLRIPRKAPQRTAAQAAQALQPQQGQRMEASHPTAA